VSALGWGAVESIVWIVSDAGPGMRSAMSLTAAPVFEGAQRLSARRCVAGEIGWEQGTPWRSET
jgi:hypothetical protein